MSENPIQDTRVLLDQLAAEIRRLLENRARQVDTEIAHAAEMKNDQQRHKLLAKKKKYTVEGINRGIGKSTFENLLEDKLKSVPSRDMIIKLANHLDCSLQERNKLLKLSGNTGDLPIPAPSVSDELLRRFSERLHRLQYPAFILNQAWDVLDANARFWHFWDVENGYEQKISPSSRNLLHCLFASHFPFRARLSPTTDDWDRLARINIRAFKQQNLHAANEAWYQEKVAELCSMDREFRMMWEEVDFDTPLQAFEDQPGVTESFYVIPVSTRDHRRGTTPPVIHVTTHRENMGDHAYPLILYYEPHGEASHAWFEAANLKDPI